MPPITLQRTLATRAEPVLVESGLSPSALSSPLAVLSDQVDNSRPTIPTRMTTPNAEAVGESVAAPQRTLPRVRGYSGVSRPWRSVVERLSFIFLNPASRVSDSDEVRDVNRRPNHAASVLTNLLSALLSLLFAPLMPFIGLVRLFQGQWVDGPLTMIFGPLVNVISALADVFIDVPRHTIAWASGR